MNAMIPTVNPITPAVWMLNPVVWIEMAYRMTAPITIRINPNTINPVPVVLFISAPPWPRYPTVDTSKPSGRAPGTHGAPSLCLQRYPDAFGWDPRAHTGRLRVGARARWN